MITRNKKKQTIKPLPFSVYFWTVFAIALAGLADSLYLAISHYRVYQDIAYSSFCSISKSVNCDTVSQSSYSIFLGVPVPVWGIVGYLFFIAVLYFVFRKDAEKERLWAFLFGISFAYSIYSVILAYISSVYIHSYCFMCVLTYAVNFLLVYFTWLVRKRFGGSRVIRALKNDVKYIWGRRAVFVPVFSGMVLCLLFLIAFLPKYWEMKPPEISTNISKGVTRSGHHWIGAKNPEIEIIEFTDYMCFQCRKMHFYLRKLVENNPDKIRLTHRHFPMDHQVNPFVQKPFHVGTGRMSILAIYAGTKDKFWVMNDILFSIDRRSKKINLKMISELSGLTIKELAASIYQPELRDKLHSDIMYGLKNGIIGTPSYIINGKVYRGQIPPDVLKRIVNN